MSNLKNIDKFDALIKGAAMDYELPFNEDAWKLMKQKLDKNNNKKKRFGFWLLLLIIIIGGVSYAFLNLKSSNNNLKNIAIINSNSNKSNDTVLINQIPSKAETGLNKKELKIENAIEDIESKQNKKIVIDDIAAKHSNKTTISNTSKLSVVKKYNQTNDATLSTFKNNTSSNNLPKKDNTKKLDDDNKEMSITVTKSVINNDELKIPTQPINSLNNGEIKNNNTKPVENKLNEIETIATKKYFFKPSKNRHCSKFINAQQVCYRF